MTDIILYVPWGIISENVSFSTKTFFQAPNFFMTESDSQKLCKILHFLQ